MGEREELTEQVRVNLKEHFDRILDEYDRRIEERFRAFELAVVLAREEAQRQYTHLNDLRREVMTDRAQFVDERVHEAKEAELLRWRKDLELRMGSIESRIAFWGGGLVVLIFLLQIVLRFLK